jgi:PEP-CTERM motif
MKKFFSAIAALALVVGMGDVANAAFIFGSLDFTQTALVPDGTAQDLATIGMFTQDDYASGANATDDFVGTPLATPVIGLTLDTSNLAAWGFSSAAFGTFSATSGVQTFNALSQRNFAFMGTFTPGALYPGKSGFVNNAVVLLSFNQAGGPNKAIGSSFTISVDPNPVPEPATIAMLGSVFGPAVAFGWMRRRRNNA